MKFRFNQKYTQIAVYAVIVIVVSGIILIGANDIPDFRQVGDLVSSCAAPLIWGAVIAYLLNPGVDFFRFKVFKKWSEKANTEKKRLVIRNVSIFIVVVLAVGLITGLLFLIIPQVTSSVSGFVSQFDTYADNFIGWVSEIFADQPQVIESLQNPLVQIENFLNNSWKDISETIVSFGTKIGGGLINFVLGFKDFIIGFIIGIYILASKEMLKAQVKKIVFAFFRNSHAQNILRVTRRTNDIFVHYLTGILIDAFFVGCLTFIGASIIGTPYPLLMAVIIACTNIIPFFGPFIGGIPACFIVLLEDPMKALWFAIFMVVMQQIDGNIMVPLIQGDRTGVPSVWVLIGLMIGGGLFGFAGMLLAVPVFAVVYMLFKEFLNSRLEKKKLPTIGALYSPEKIDRYVDGYSYSEEERKADDERYMIHDDKKFKPLNLFRKKEKGENDEADEDL